MANRNLFAALAGKLTPAVDALNEERAPAYALSPKQTLAQYAATGCLSSTFYASDREQLDRVLTLCPSL
ncbi:MAG: RNA-binding protein, partial [Deltaproteobacteria bacterium]|nr:RNA-binding protein [Deltaproteobacteria bacterium]